MSLCAAALVNSCSDTSERNVITERSPFFHTAIPYNRADTERAISTVRRFAAANGMDFLLAQDSLPPGDFNATAAGRNLNLTAMHTEAISSDMIDVFVTARSAPTAADEAKARGFVCALRRECLS
jgi:hypothetical protein